MEGTTGKWYAESAEAAFSELRSTVTGLTSAEALERRKMHGLNVLSATKQRTHFQILLAQFQSPLILILAVSAGISFSFRALTDGWIIIAIVLFNGIIGFIQEHKAGEAMERLKSLSPQLVRVFRDGEERELSADELVVGDVVLLEAGSVVPADGRIVEAANLKANEAIFTGESVSTEKTSDRLSEQTVQTERRNIAWRGTTVVAGRGKLLVTDVGMATRYGMIIREVSEITNEVTPFQMRMAEFAKKLAVVVIVLAVAVLLLGIARGHGVERSVLLSISLVVSMIPEGLPVVITLAFAMGMWQMAKRRALIRKLYAVETLGSVTMIVSDKTGTLTFGEMMVEDIVTGHREIHVTGEGYRRTGDFFERGKRVTLLDDVVLRKLVEVGALNNDSRITHNERKEEQWIGDPTEVALAVLGDKAGFKHSDLDTTYPRVGEFPFDFTLKYMVTFHQTTEGQYLICVKGAPRTILSLCTLKRTPDGVVPLTDKDKDEARGKFEAMAKRSLRGLCLAYAETKTDWRSITHSNLGEHLVYLGIVGIRDPIRPEAKETIEAARQAGIRVVMLTGDYRVTAVSVAKDIGILMPREEDRHVLDGSALDGLDDAALAARLKTALVFSRVSPEQKLRIARTLRKNGEVIAMTGDGINDVPALTEADIGVAIGMSSADAAKETAEMVVTDGNLASIVAAVEEGRAIFRNIQRVLIFLLASNMSDLLVILGAMSIGFPLPLLPIHVIWLNVITDPFLGVALAREPKSPSIMHEPPRKPGMAVLTTGHWGRIFLGGVTVTLSTLAVFLLARAQHRASGEIYAMTLTTIAMGQWFVAFMSRSGRRSAFSRIRKSPWLLVALAASLGLQVSILYIPTMAAAFHLAPISAIDWLVIVAASFFAVIVDEVRKLFIRRRYVNATP